MATSVSKIYLSSDHAGCALRRTIAAHLIDLDHGVEDLGPATDESVDYPDYGAKLAKAMQEDPDSRGVAVCGSGVGISIALNRFPWMRAALVGDATAARLCREHNDANVLALGERLTGVAVALDCVDIFLKTEFEGGRHARRVDKLESPGETVKR